MSSSPVLMRLRSPPDNPTIQQSSNPTMQQSNNPTIQQIVLSLLAEALLTNCTIPRLLSHRLYRRHSCNIAGTFLTNQLLAGRIILAIGSSKRINFERCVALARKVVVAATFHVGQDRLNANAIPSIVATPGINFADDSFAHGILATFFFTRFPTGVIVAILSHHQPDLYLYSSSGSSVACLSKTNISLLCYAQSTTPY
jgi:hypothetical protein